jgi:hypothetical protein
VQIGVEKKKKEFKVYFLCPMKLQEDERSKEMTRIKTDVEDDEQIRHEIPCTSPYANKYWLTRIVFLRYLAFIYLVAFLIAFHQTNP